MSTSRHEDSQIFEQKRLCQGYAWAHLLSLSEKNEPRNNRFALGLESAKFDCQ